MSAINFPGGSGGSAQAVRVVDVESVWHLNATNYSTISSSLAAIDDTNLGITVDLVAGDEVLLELTAPFSIASAGNIIGVDWAVDVPTGTDVVGIAVDAGAYASASIELGNSAADVNTRTARSKFTATEAGSHVLKPRWRVGGGTTGYIRQASAENYETPILHTATIRRPAA